MCVAKVSVVSVTALGSSRHVRGPTNLLSGFMPPDGAKNQLFAEGSGFRLIFGTSSCSWVHKHSLTVDCLIEPINHTPLDFVGFAVRHDGLCTCHLWKLHGVGRGGGMAMEAQTPSSFATRLCWSIMSNQTGQRVLDKCFIVLNQLSYSRVLGMSVCQRGDSAV